MDDMKTETAAPSDADRTAAASPATPPTGPKKLYRSRDNRVVKGVAGGVGEYFGIDPVIVRLAFLFTFALGGVGFFGYLLAVVLLPKRPKNLPAPTTPTTSGFEALQNRSLGVWVLVGIGAAILVDRLNLNIIGDRLWPLLLIGGGLVVLMRRRDANAIRQHNEARGANGWDNASTTTTGGTRSRSFTAPMSTGGATTSTFSTDGSLTRRDLQAEALAELHDPVVDEVERAVAELRSERLGRQFNSRFDSIDDDLMAEVPDTTGQSRRARRAHRRGRQNGPDHAPRSPHRSRLRRFIVACLLFTVFLVTVCAFVGLRIVTRGAGQREVAIAVGATNFSQTFGAGDFRLDLSTLDGPATGKASLDFGKLTVALPTGPNRPAVEIHSRSRIVIAETGIGGSTEAFIGNRTRTIPGCGRNARVGSPTIKLNISMLAGNLDLVPAGPCPSASTAASTAAIVAGSAIPGTAPTPTTRLR